MIQLGSTCASALASLGVNPPLARPSQSESWPLSERHNMSSRSSPLKSPVPTTIQLAATLVKALASLGVNPPPVLPSQSDSWPLAERHSRSSLPSPLKSPAPTTFQLGSTVVKALASL